MENTAVLDGYSVHCSCELREGPYFRVLWVALWEGYPSPEAEHFESYICHAEREVEALAVVMARAQVMVRLLGGLRIASAAGSCSRAVSFAHVFGLF